MSRIAEQLLRRKVRYRDLVGARVQLVQAMETIAGKLFPTGLVLDVTHTYRGRFDLCRPGAVTGYGPDNLVARQVPAAAFELLECRVCGCDHLHACRTASGPCSWSKKDPTLCTACEDVGKGDA